MVCVCPILYTMIYNRNNTVNSTCACAAHVTLTRQVVRVSVVGGFAAGLPAAPPGAPATIGLRNSWQRGTGYPHHADMCFGGFASQEGGRGARQGEVREGVEQEDRRLQEREHHG